jgi:hypothetical protein
MENNFGAGTRTVSESEVDSLLHELFNRSDCETGQKYVYSMFHF